MGLIKHKVWLLMDSSAGYSGANDVSEDVMSINIDQDIATESDPAKVEIMLADVEGKYDVGIVPQKTVCYIILYYIKEGNVSISKDANGQYFPSVNEGETWTFPAFKGIVTDAHNISNYEVQVNCSCFVEHLSDALPVDWNKKGTQQLTNKLVIDETLKMHSPPLQFAFNSWIFPLNEKNYKPIETFQDVVDDIRWISGAFVYTDEGGVINVIDPKLIRPSEKYMQELDYYVTNNDNASSVMQFHTMATVVADGSLREEQLEGAETPYHANLSKTYMGPLIDGKNPVEEYEVLDGPVEYNPYIKSEAILDFRTKQLWYYYRLHENALSTVTVVAKVPFLHSMVWWSTASPIFDEMDLRQLSTDPNIQSAMDKFLNTVHSGSTPNGGISQIIADVSSQKANFDKPIEFTQAWEWIYDTNAYQAPTRPVIEDLISKSAEMNARLTALRFLVGRWITEKESFQVLDGIVKRKQVDYSGHDFVCTLTLFNRADMESALSGDDIEVESGLSQPDDSPENMNSLDVMNYQETQNAIEAAEES